MAGLSVIGCSRMSVDEPNIPDGSQEIVLAVEGDNLDMEVDTKTLTALPSTLYWEATTGTFKSETAAKWNTSGTVSSGKIATGKYQSATAVSYNYYLSNKAITFASGGSTISASNADTEPDAIAGCTTAATSSTAPSVTMDHIFARTGTLTAKPESGYTLSGVSCKIASKSSGTGGTKGTYNIATKAWSSVTALSSTTLGSFSGSSTSQLTSSSDMYLTPGVYTITVTYTLTIGDGNEWTKTFTKSGDVTLVAGKVNSITWTCPSDGTATKITISVALNSWGTQALTLTLS